MPDWTNMSPEEEAETINATDIMLENDLRRREK